MLLLLAAALFGIAAYVLLEGMTVRQREIAVSLKRARRYGGVTLRETELGRNVQDRVIGPSLKSLAGFVGKLPMTASQDEIARKLLASGMAKKFTPQSFLAFKAVAAVGGLGIGGILSLGGNPKGLLWGLLFAFLGFVMPDYIVTVRTRRRKEDIVIQLPDVIDLLCVSVEAGLGFDGALARISERSDGPLIEELRMVLHEMRIGESRQQALKNLAERCAGSEVSGFARSIIQADQLGMSLGRVLRVQSQDIRNKRQMDAEAKAMKAPIKMLFPTVIFIFPAMFIVVLGPAMMSLAELFASTS